MEEIIAPDIEEEVGQRVLGIGELLMQKTTKPKKIGQRDELIDYFYKKLLPYWTGKGKFTRSFVKMKIKHLRIRDLYFLKSICDDSERRKGSFFVTFWGSLNPK